MKLLVTIVSLLVLITGSFSAFSVYAHQNFMQERKKVSNELIKMEKDFFAAENNPFIFYYFAFCFFEKAGDFKHENSDFNVFSDKCLPSFLTPKQKDSCKELLRFYQAKEENTEYINNNDNIKKQSDLLKNLLKKDYSADYSLYDNYSLYKFLMSIFFEIKKQSVSWSEDDALELLGALNQIADEYNEFEHKLAPLFKYCDNHDKKCLNNDLYNKTNKIECSFTGMNFINDLIIRFTGFDKPERINAIFLCDYYDSLVSFFQGDMKKFSSFLQELEKKIDLEAVYQSLAEVFDPVIELCFQIVQEQQIEIKKSKINDKEEVIFLSIKGTQLRSDDYQTMTEYFLQNKIIPIADQKEAAYKFAFFCYCDAIYHSLKSFKYEE